MAPSRTDETYRGKSSCRWEYNIAFSSFVGHVVGLILSRTSLLRPGTIHASLSLIAPQITDDFSYRTYRSTYEYEQYLTDRRALLKEHAQYFLAGNPGVNGSVQPTPGAWDLAHSILAPSLQRRLSTVYTAPSTRKETRAGSET